MIVLITVGFVLEDLRSKEVTVIDRHKLQFKPQFDLYEPAIITPQKVTVYGPSNILDTLSIVYTEMLALSNLDEDVSVDIGVESGSEKVRNDIKKGFTEEDMHHTLESLLENGIQVRLLFLVGYPTETEEDFSKNVKYGCKVCKMERFNVCYCW